MSDLGAGTVAAVIGVVIAVVGVVFALGQWKGRVDEAQSTFKRTLDGFMAEIRSDIKRIFERLPAETVGVASPTRLTELGRSVSRALDAPAWAVAHAQGLLNRTADLTAYDIQALAFKYTGEEFKPNAAMENRIKECAFENGLKPKQVLDVLAIELRDRLLELRQLKPPKA